jgi:hypothetical protein
MTDSPSGNNEKKYWKNPNNYIRVATLVAVGAYTVITLFLLYSNKDAERRQLRAYLFLVPKAPDFENGKEVVSRLEIRNSGLTPAYNIRVVFNSAGLPGGDRPRSERELDSQNSAVKNNPHARYMLATKPDIFSVIDHERWKLGNNERVNYSDGQSYRFYNWGRIDYTDSFQCHHYINFCFAFFGESLPPDKERPIECDGMKMETDTQNECD